MMRSPFPRKNEPPTPAPAGARMPWSFAWRALVAVFGAMLLPAFVWAGPGDPGNNPPAPVAITGAATHVTAERNGALTTADGLTLRVNTDMGSVRIVPLENGAAPVVRYLVHLETDAREPQATTLLTNYVLKAKNTS